MSRCRPSIREQDFICAAMVRWRRDPKQQLAKRGLPLKADVHLRQSAINAPSPRPKTVNPHGRQPWLDEEQQQSNETDLMADKRRMLQPLLHSSDSIIDFFSPTRRNNHASMCVSLKEQSLSCTAHDNVHVLTEFFIRMGGGRGGSL